MDFGHPPLCDQGSQTQTSRVGREAMNAELCPVHCHHIPLEPHCGVQRSGGESMPGQDRAGQGRAGQDRTGQGRAGQDREGRLAEKTLSRLSACHIVIKHEDACGSVHIYTWYSLGYSVCTN